MLGKYDKVLGLGLNDVTESYSVPDDILDKVEQRAGVRQEAQRENAAITGGKPREARKASSQRQALHEQADALREEITRAGYVVQDTPSGSRVRPKTPWERREEAWPTVSSPSEGPGYLHEMDSVDFSVGVVASNYVEDVCRCIQSTLRWTGRRPVEVVVVDNGSTDGTSEWLEKIASRDPRIRVIHTDHVLGEGAAKNIALRQSRGRIVVLLDTSAEVRGDIFGPIQSLLNDDTIGVTGPFGLRSNDLHHFHDGEGEAGDMDAMQAYCFAFRRSLLTEVGIMRESFRFYRNLDLDYSFHFKDKGYRIVAEPELPVRRHEHRVWSELGENEREESSRKNYKRFLDKWGERSDLLLDSQAAH